MEDSNELIVEKKSWWQRNWIWFVPTGCLSLIILFCLFIAGLFFGVTSMLKGEDSYKAALNKAQHNKIIIERLGSPIEEDGIASGSINVNNDIKHCDLQIPIKGPKGKATLFVVATKKGTWKYSEMNVFIKATNEEIDLLKK
jgi:hypothetical protein